MNKRIARICAVGMSALLIMAVVVSNLLFWSVSAETDSTELLKKTLLNALRTCTTDTYMVESIAANDYFGVSNLITSSDHDGIIWVPSNVGNSLGDQEVSCEQVFTGYHENKTSNSIKGLFALYGKTNGDKSFLYYYGSSDDTASDGGSYGEGCMYVKYAGVVGKQQTTFETNKLCFRLKGENIYRGDDSWSNIISKEEPSDDALLSIFASEDTYGGVDIYLNSTDTRNVFTFPMKIKSGVQDNDSWEDVIGKVSQWFYDEGKCYLADFLDDNHENLGYDCGSDVVQTSISDNAVEYITFVKRDDVATKLLHYFTGDAEITFDDIKFTEQEKYDLYMKYVDDTMQEHTSVYLASECYSSKDDASADTGYAIPSGGQWCGIYGVEEVGDDFNTINHAYNALQQNTFAGVVQGLMNIDYSQVDGIIEFENGALSGTIEETQDTVATATTCYNSGKGLGWIICAVLEGMTDVVGGIYDNVIAAQFLEVESSLMESGGPLYEGWQTFLGFANLIFVFVFIVVILSQLTGIGVSNYGIKKALPRLIAIAVLVNISFFVCQLAVDVSNLLGYALENLFVNLAGEVTTLGDFTISVADNLFGTVVSGIVLGGIIFIAALTWEFWLIPLLLFFAGAIVAVIVFAIILGVRKAAILILTVISPVAIICYALPNTKKLFDKWLHAFSSLLLVFPICGLIMGGGLYTSKLLLSAGASNDDLGFFFALVAMLLQIVPVFFIPTLVKKSMMAIGNIGARISSAGSRLSRGATTAIQHSGAYQDATRQLQTRNAEKNYKRLDAGKGVRNRLAKALEGTSAGEALANSAQRSSTRYKNKAYAGRMEGIKAEAGALSLEKGSPLYAAMLDQEIQKQNDTMVGAYATNYTRNGMADDIPAMQREYTATMAELGKNSNDQNARTKILAIHKLLGDTEPGRAALQNGLYTVVADMKAPGHQVTQDEENALTFATNSLRRTHWSAINSANSGFGSFIGDATQGSGAIKGNFSAAGDLYKNENGQAVAGVAASAYDGARVGNYDAAGLAKVDKSALGRIQHAAKTGQMSKESINAFDTVSREALTSSNIHVQPKMSSLINETRETLGLDTITPRAT